MNNVKIIETIKKNCSYFTFKMDDFYVDNRTC